MCTLLVTETVACLVLECEFVQFFIELCSSNIYFCPSFLGGKLL
jgi:hypothetical protein